jgi:hypothetical protein
MMEKTCEEQLSENSCCKFKNLQIFSNPPTSIGGSFCVWWYQVWQTDIVATSLAGAQQP